MIKRMRKWLTAVTVLTVTAAAGAPAALLTDARAAEAAETKSAQDSVTCPKGWNSEDPGWYRAYMKQRAAGTEEALPDSSTARVSVLSAYSKTQWKTTSGKVSFYHDPEDTEGCEVIPVVDVSKYDGTVNYRKLKNSGVSGVIIRCGYRTSSGGSIYTDPYWIYNVKQATAAGLHVGVYFFSQAKTTAEAKAEAAYTLKLLQGETGRWYPGDYVKEKKSGRSGTNCYGIDLPVFMDVEYVGDGGRLARAHLSKAAQTRVAKAYCQAMKDAGYDAMVYASSNFFVNKLDGTALYQAGYPLWMARYYNYAYRSTSSVSASNLYRNRAAVDYWQCSETARVGGINTNVDLNFWYRPASWTSGNIGIRKAAPSGISVGTANGLNVQSVSRTGIRLSWNAAENAGGYRLYYSTSRNGSYRHTDVSGTAFTLNGLKSDREYYFKVRAYQTKEDGSRVYGKTSGILSASTSQTNSFHLVARSKTHLRSGAGTAYRVRKSVKKGTKLQFVRWTSDKHGAAWAKVKYGSSVYYVSRSMVKYPTPKIRDLRGVSAGASGVKLSWKKTSAAYYKVYRSTSSATGFRCVKNTRTASWKDTTGKAGVTYYYKVRGAKNYNGRRCLGAFSSAAAVRR
ncbi:GH25 family lysozyme [Clostridium sp. SY8519]|uniref:GH25 family lysozyme n=1 Tax=Clostridium sp. (strain SY8519) TaxID=1042156 RepID=UPI000A00F02A|nr:GH25 family lysozyme [Clostridium sp. SY8519]